MQTSTFVKRTMAVLLALAMLFGMVACAKQPKTQKAENTEQLSGGNEAYTREEMELIVDLLGDGHSSDNMTDEELLQKVEQIVGNTSDKGSSQIVNLGDTKKEELPVVDTSENKDAYDENGAMTKPFDQVYPELIEKEQVSFSGESILVKMKNDTLTDGLKAAGVGALEQIVPLDGCAWYEARLVKGTDAQKALAAVRELKEVQLAEYNYEIKTAAIDDYKHFDKKQEEEFKKNGHNKDQWHFHYVGIPGGYEEMETEGGDSSVVVAVIDTGVDYDHEDLKDNIWVNAAEIPNNNRDDDGNGYIDDYYGIDLIAGKGSADDDNGHGTHVAGIIAARNNNVGVLGVAYSTKIMPIKAAMHNGTLNQATIAKAILYAYEMGAEVINMSFGGSACSIAVQDALAVAYTRSVLVASAGNSGKPNEVTDYDYMPLPNYPAALTYVLGVMSVDENGVESSFSNWDVKAFNGVEYEMYAPGENIMSTLPNNQYGFLTGTSMAAPMVSAMAAILRSEFADRDKYPTKFIYGQLSSTSDYYADCIDPEAHKVNGKLHNLPQIVNLDAALTKLPKPEVNLQDYAIFDSKELSDKNNGDGVIDAGETIALGLTLRNRWGMSENTKVTIDTLENGIADPYVTIVNPTVDYGGVGTYSTQDCGKIYTDELHTGWENPFIIKIADNIPNDYRMTFHVTVRCENALDEADTATYESTGDIDLTARNGVVLPSVIEEDMVLTADNLYIIPNATVIQEGVTVKVMPGTHIQFWSDDANDPYAGDYIAYLLVNGKFLVEGTKEAPVYIYPSQLMDRYGVEIGSSSTGYVSLKYADITNFFYYSTSKTGTDNRIDLADHCTFRVNYSSGLRYRYLSEGAVKDSYVYSYTIGNITAKDSVFYKIGNNNTVTLNGSAQRCIFVDCGIRYGGTYNDCVFLGNSLVDQTSPDSYSNSSMEVSTIPLPDAEDLSNNVFKVYYRPETGTTYVEWTDHGNSENAKPYAVYLQEIYGGGYMQIETADEKEWIAANLDRSGKVGVRWDMEQECYLWYDGTPVDLELFPNLSTRLGEDDYYISWKHSDDKLVYSYMNETWYEIPGPILPTDITFADYVVEIDLESTYQIAPKNTPVQLPANAFLYESSDESVLTVSETGLVTPVGKGTADVWVYSLDKAVKNHVTITVKDYVPLEGIAFPVATVELAVGETAAVGCILTPADTTRRNVVYTSSDETVAMVDNGGVITAVGKGTATITATCEGLTATMEVTTFVRASSLTYKTYQHNKTMESGDTALPELTVSPANADLDLLWTARDESILSVQDGKLLLKKAGSTYLDVTDLNSGLKTTFYFSVTATAPTINEDVIAAQVSDGAVALPTVTLGKGAETTPVWEILDPAVAELHNGKIRFKAAGLTTLRVTDPRNGLTDEIFIYVTEEETPKVKELQVDGDDGNIVYVLMENGDLYGWNTSTTVIREPVFICSNVKAFDCYYYYLTVLLEDNTVEVYYWSTSTVAFRAAYRELQTQSCIDVAGYQYMNSAMDGSLFVLTEDGTVYALGSSNTYGHLGTGNQEAVTEFTKVQLSEPVKQVAYQGYTGYYLTENGNLYVSGGGGLQAATPIMIARNVTWLDDHGMWFVTNNQLASFDSTDTEPNVLTASLAGYTMLDVRYYSSGSSSYFDAWAVKDGDVYSVSGEGSVASTTRFKLNSDVVAAGTACVYSYYGNKVYYVVTEDGMLFANGTNYNNSTNRMNGFLDMTNDFSRSSIERPVFLPIVRPAEKLNLLQTNLEGDSVLSTDALELTFNKQLLKASATIYENGTVMVAHTEFDGNILLVSPAVGFAKGVEYKVVISAIGTVGISSVHPVEDIIITFTYQAPASEEIPGQTQPEDEETQPTLPSAPIEPEAPVIHKSILDESIERYLTAERLIAKLDAFIAETQYNPDFYGNAILNPVSTDTEVTHWLRPLAPSVSSGSYSEIPLGGNYWGTTNETAIGLQMVDYTDFITYARLMYAPYLTEAPENTFPFVTAVKLINRAGEEVTTVGNEEITFRVTFNRDMDTSIPLQVRFGSAYPYGDYEIKGQYVDARTWEGIYTLNTLIENGNQYFTISNGCSATDDLALQIDQARFGFVIDTTAAQALIMQGTATDTGIQLKWTQDDFDTLMGYNVYRSTKEDGLYTRLNSTVIPTDTMQWFDNTVEPGVVYYYNFTVVKTDLTESEPSGKISIMSKDTMAPDIYHSPAGSAFTGANLVISATVTDNLNIAYANLYYRVAGTDTWKIVRMNALNDKYSAIIPAADVTLAGIEYYIEAFDGVSFTYKGSAEAPFAIAVQEAVDADALGDVDGDGVITNRDALILLYAINDKYNMTAEEFARADLNGDGELWAAEALRILQYVSGVVGSVKM